MTTESQINEKEIDFFGGYFDTGLADTKSVTPPDVVTGAQMGEAMWRAGAIAAHATKIADVMGEENAILCLQSALVFLQAHCAHARAKKGN